MVSLLLLFSLLAASPLGAAPLPTDPPPAEAILVEINRARTAPQLYAAQLQRFRAAFQGKHYYKSGSPIRYLTSEGVGAVDDAGAFLARQSPLPPLQWSEQLAAAARELAQEQARTGAFGHGQGETAMTARIERHGEWHGGYAENVSYGDYRSDAAGQIVLEMIVDDGVPDRGHRLNLFAAEYHFAGIACAPHPLRKTVCVVDFAGAAPPEEGR